MVVAAGTTSAQPPVPAEPENDNREYVLDAVTNDYNRQWREVWAGGDNRFRMRLGSNNVTQWMLEEEFKFSASLVDRRLRFRFHHQRFDRYSVDRLTGDTIEFEARMFGDNYLSLYVTPTSARSENTLGLIAQHRRQVNRYARFIVEFPHVVRNFNEDHKGFGDSPDVVFADRPLRLALDVRERVCPGVWFSLEGEIVPEFTVNERDGRTRVVTRSESVEAASLGGWVEYSWPGEKELPDRSSAGVQASWQEDDRAENVPTLAAPAGSRGRLADADGALAAGSSPLMAFDKDLYWISANDSIAGWKVSRSSVKPYAWIVLDDRWTVRGVLLFEERSIRLLADQGVETVIDNRYVAPALGARLSLGHERRAIVELGWASLFRKRTERRGGGARDEMRIDDQRLYVGFDYVFATDRRVSITESFELDARDRGQYGIHDHAFVQMIFGF